MADWLPHALSYIPEWIEFQRRLTDLPGCAIAVASAGEPVLHQAFGVANLATGERLTPAHRFRIASHSKTFTAAGILKLVESGRLRLDDPAGQYVPGLSPDVGAATLRQLLSHTAGLTRDGTDAGQWVDRRPFLNAAELCAALAEPPVLPANTRMKYSNHGFGLLGLVIEAATGESYTAWISREVVAAAGLANTQSDAPAAPGVPVSRGHSSKVLLGKRVVVPADNPTNALASATGFMSTAGDLVRFYASLDPEAPESVLSVASRREMTRRHWRVPDWTLERYYGLGTVHGQLGDWAWFGHGGGFQGVMTQSVTVPAQKLTVSVLTNAADGAPQVLIDGVLNILQAFARHGPPAEAVAGWTRRWWSGWSVTDLVPMGERVVAALPGQPNPFADAPELTVTGLDTARISKATGMGSFGETARLVRDRRGRVTEFWLAGSRMLPEAAYAKEFRARYQGGGRGRSG